MVSTKERFNRVFTNSERIILNGIAEAYRPTSFSRAACLNRIKFIEQVSTDEEILAEIRGLEKKVQSIDEDTWVMLALVMPLDVIVSEDDPEEIPYED